MATTTKRRSDGKPGKDWYQVNEIFESVQGEGMYSGIRSTFIRLQGCDVGCPWCDSGPLADEREGRHTNGLTRNTWGSGGERWKTSDILKAVSSYHVVITGGEPIIWDLDALVLPLQEQGHTVQIETSGRNDFIGQIVPDWITWSPKQSLKWDAPEAFKHRSISEVKWVVDDQLSWVVVKRMWDYMMENAATVPPYFVLMPEGCPPKQETITRCLDWIKRLPFDEQMFWRVTDRMQYRFGVR